MKSKHTKWSKDELKTYILLCFAKGNQAETKEDIALIKSKTHPETFDKIYDEFSSDDEDMCFKKIEDVLEEAFSPYEISEIKKEINAVFISDKKFEEKQHHLSKVLDNLIY